MQETPYLQSITDIVCRSISDEVMGWFPKAHHNRGSPDWTKNTLATRWASFVTENFVNFF